MKCPKCSSENSAVLDSRGDGEAIRRRRTCKECDFRFTTFERIEFVLPMVVKKDGRREAYNREKVRAGFVRACEKRPVSLEKIGRTVDEIERKLYQSGEKEVRSILIGDLVMEALKDFDKIAYIRFASVYRQFNDVNQFVEALESLARGQRAGKT